MKVFLVLLPLMVTQIALGFHTLGESGEGNAATFSEKFRHAYTAATSDQSKPDAVTQLEEMREKCTRPEEIAEIELTLGVIYGQRAGMVDQVKAVPHFTKALNHEPPATVRTGVLVWRGNALEQQKRYRAALPDYLRGLVICTQFDLFHGWPKDPPSLQEDPRPESAVDPTALEGRRSGPGRSGPDALAQHRLIRIEREMLMHRYYLVDAVQRIAKHEKLDAIEAEQEIAYLVSDSRRATQIMLWCQDKNERPWR